MRRGMIMSRRWARGRPRAPRRDGTASGGENPGLVAEQHLPDLLRTAADSFSSGIADRRTFLGAFARSPIDDVDPATLPATLSRPRKPLLLTLSLTPHACCRNVVSVRQIRLADYHVNPMDLERVVGSSDSARSIIGFQ